MATAGAPTAARRTPHASDASVHARRRRGSRRERCRRPPVRVAVAIAIAIAVDQRAREHISGESEQGLAPPRRRRRAVARCELAEHLAQLHADAVDECGRLEEARARTVRRIR